MKTLAALMLAGMSLIATGSALAGRDLSQIMEQERAAKARHAEQLAQAQQKGLAGAVGIPGNIGPGTQRVTTRRDPSAHP